MSYYLTKAGNIVDETLQIVPMIEAEEGYQTYLIWLSNGGELVEINLTPSEQGEHQIDSEYRLYLKRKDDGINAYLRISAELRTAKLGGIINEEQHQAIEAALEPTRAEVVLGQWIGARDKLIALGTSIIGQSLYDDLMSRLDNYINENY